MRRKAILGWGVVAPKSANIEEFGANLQSSESWLSPFNGFGRDSFLVGQPKFDFRDYQPWIEQRFPPSRFNQLKDKMDLTTLYAVGAFIQALGHNPGIEQELRELRGAAHVYASTAIGAFPTLHNASLQYHRGRVHRSKTRRTRSTSIARKSWKTPGSPIGQSAPISWLSSSRS